MVLKIKLIIYKIFISIFIAYELTRFVFFSLRNRNIVVFDIDNTLVDTASMLKKIKSIDYAWEFAPCNLAIKSTLIDYIKGGYKIVILSARPYNKKHLSRSILASNNIAYHLLIHSSSVSAKLIFYLFAFNRLVVYDDLSYGEESGKVMFYTDQIRTLTTWSKIEYHGYYDIRTLIERSDDNEN